MVISDVQRPLDTVLKTGVEARRVATLSRESLAGVVEAALGNRVWDVTAESWHKHEATKQERTQNSLGEEEGNQGAVGGRHVGRAEDKLAASTDIDLCMEHS